MFKLENSFSKEFKYVKDLVLESGKYLRKNFLLDTSSYEKEKGHLTTKFDLEIEKNYKENLSSKYPDIKFFGEELGGIKDSQARWIVDSLDGTVNYIFGIPYFCTSIALEINNKILLGIVYNPISNELYESYSDTPYAYLNEDIINTSNESNINNARGIFGFSANFNNINKYYKDWKFLMENYKKGLGMLSPALNICNVARGRIDFFIDFGCSMEGQSAAAFILKKAGGFLLDYDKSHWNHKNTGIIATNNKLQLC